MTIGERIKHRREELQMTQEELATKLGYKSRSSINKIELGTNELTQKKIVDIAYALETTPEYIMGWDTEEPDKPDPKKAQFEKLLAQLSEDDLKKVLELAQLLLMAERQINGKEDVADGQT